MNILKFDLILIFNVMKYIIFNLCTNRSY